MMTVRRSHLLLAGLVGGLAIVVPTFRSRSDELNATQLVSSWAGTVKATNPPGLEPFTSLITFSPGGGVVESRRLYVPNSPFGPLLETPGHGAWTRIAGRELEIQFLFLLQGAPNNPTTAGAALGTDNIRMRVRLSPSGDVLEGTFVSRIKDLSGAVVFTASGTYRAQRIVIE
jgi:hypothetical protein